MLKLHHDSQLDSKIRCGSSIIISLYRYNMHVQIVFIILITGCSNVVKKEKMFDELIRNYYMEWIIVITLIVDNCHYFI